MESTLSITRTELRQAIGAFVGFGDDPGGWTEQRRKQVERAISSGLRQAYGPPILPGERTSHAWSFLRPTLRLSIEEGTNEYDLPDTFGGLVNTLSFIADDNAIGCPLRQTGVAEIQALRQNDPLNGDGQPALFAIEPLASDGDGPQKQRLQVWPDPDGDYTLVGPYILNPYNLSEEQPYPLGGQPHAEMLRESCLAAAELEINGERGIHYQVFIERLAASVSHDRRVSTPRAFGYNGDRSGIREDRLDRSLRRGVVTYNGVDYS